MKKKSIKELFAELEGMPSGEGKTAGAKGGAKPAAAEEGPSAAGGEQPADAKPNAAELVGRAMLDKLGGVEGVSEDELAQAILGALEDPQAAIGDEAMGWRRPWYEPELNVTEGEPEQAEAPRAPFAEPRRAPAPLRSGGVEPAPVDYENMSRERFMRLKKQLQKAAADGKRVRL